MTGGAATTDSAPVDLATPVDLADGRARPPAIVRAGDARFEVLSPLLIRLEYSPSGRFEDRPSVNAVDRDLPVPRYRTTVSRGWITIRTRRALLRYRLGSGPFTPTPKMPSGRMDAPWAITSRDSKGASRSSKASGVKRQ